MISSYRRFHPENKKTELVAIEMPMTMNWKAALLALTVFTTTPVIAWAAETEFALIIKNHAFEPDTLIVPAGERIKLVVKNEDGTREEFESEELHIEKIVGGGKSITVFIGPLKPGTYEFVGEFHEDSAKGKLIAQ